MKLDIKDLSTVEVQNYLQHAIAPRPICFASTIDKERNVNLSPFSFFNMFSSNPPIVIFSPARRVRNNTIKHTLQNLQEVPEVVINIVDYDMVQQVSLSSCEYPKEINEFLKSGFTTEKAQIVKPPMVKESKIKLECLVKEIKPLGTEGGAGNLVICEVVYMHIDDSILDENKKIDQKKMHHVARLGGDWYTKVDESSLFQVRKPHTQLGIGLDALPSFIRNSEVLSGNNLGQLGNVHIMPEIDPNFKNEKGDQIHKSTLQNDKIKQLHSLAKDLLDHNNVDEAWQILLSAAD